MPDPFETTVYVRLYSTGHDPGDECECGCQNKPLSNMITLLHYSLLPKAERSEWHPVTLKFEAGSTGRPAERIL